MSDYWKKKLEELNQEQKASTSSSNSNRETKKVEDTKSSTISSDTYWEQKLNEVNQEKKSYTSTRTSATDMTTVGKLSSGSGQQDKKKLTDEVSQLSALYDSRKKERDSLVNQINIWENPTTSAAMHQNEVVRQRNIEYLRGELAKYDDLEELGATLSQKQKQLKDSQDAEDFAKLVSVVNSEDFEKYSTIGKNIKNPEARTAVYLNNPSSPDYGKGSDLDSEAYETGNKVEWERAKGAGHIYQELTEDEVAIYNYYLGKGDKESADRFLELMDTALKYRSAESAFEDLEGKTAAEILYGGIAGLDQFVSGVANLGNMVSGKDETKASFNSMLAGMVREDLGDVGPKILGLDHSLGQIGFDIMNTGANMAPSIAVSTLSNIVAPGSGAVIGSALMGGSASGNAYKDALSQGYEKEEARKYAILVGVSEATLQNVLGGIGKLGGTSQAINKAVSGIKNGGVRFLAEYGGKIASEALEEGLQEILDPLFKNAVMGADEDIDWEEVGYSALLGGFMGAGFGASEVKQSHLSNNEQRVVNQIYKDRMAQEEKNGKVSNSKKSDIYEKVLSDMEKGRISAEEIESILGGEAYETFKAERGKFFDSDQYKAYQKAVQDEKTAKAEFDPLVKMKQGEMTGEQVYRRDELKKLLDESKVGEMKTALSSEADRIIGLRNQMRSEVMKMVKDSRLAESYNELARKGQKFEVDVSKYKNENARKTVQSILDSGLGDNTNQFHETVDWLASLSEQKGLTFDLTNNEKLKGTEHYKEGYITHGFVNENGDVLLNMDSDRVLETTVGHEITHVLEKAGIYKDLSKAVRDFAISKEGQEAYNKRLADIKEIYGEDQAKIDSELTADIIGQYLFTDYDFVHNLSTQNRNVFQKVYDEIKYLVKLATAGSKEARDLEKVKKMFDKAWRENVEGKSEKTQFSLSIKHSNGTIEEIADARDLTHERAIKYLEQAKSGELRRDTYIPVRKDTPQVVIDTLAQVNEIVENRSMVMKVKKAVDAMKDEDNRRAKKYGNNVRKHGLKPEQILAIIDGLDNPSTIIYETNRYDDDGKKLPNAAAVFVNYEQDGVEALAVVEFENPRKTDAIGLEYGDTEFHTVVTVFVPDVMRDGMPYDHIEELLSDNNNYELEIKRRQSTESATGANQPNTFNELPSIDATVAQEKGIVNHSFSRDTQGRDLTAEQQEFFKDSKVVDENGNLKVMYHGTPNGDFTIFKDGTYFTDNKEYADRYQNPSASSISSGKTASNPKTFEVYLDIKKPFDLNDPEARDIYINEYIKGGNAMGINPYLSNAEYAKIKTIDWTEGEDLRDFLIENGYDYDGLVLDEGADGGYGDDVKSRGTSWVVFSPEQIKNVDNAKPTPNPDIRFSMSKAVEETKDLMALHNLHSSELLKQLKMGGMAYPSIAVTKPELFSHDGFGEVSVILRKDAIDPKKSKYNKIYSVDAYTPTFPNVDYEASEQVAAKITSKVNELYDKLPEYYQRSLRSLRDYTNIDDQLNRWGGEHRLAEKYADDYAMKQLYLAEKGEAVPVRKKTTETRMTDYQMKLYQAVVDTIGEDVLKSFNEKGSFEKLGLARMAWLEKHGDALKNIYAEDWSSDGTVTREEALEIANEQKPIYWKSEIDQVLGFIKTGGVTVTETDDIGATQAKIDEKIAGSDYKQWVDNLFSGIEGQSGIRNSKDIFTPSGNRRSFAQTHDPLTIDNIVKAMRKENQTGQGAFGGGSILGASAKEFGSIAEVKKNSGKLGMMDKAEHDAITDKINDTFWDIARRYANGKDIIDAQEAIAEAVSKNESKAGIARYLKQYDYVYQYTDSIGDEIIELRDYIRSLPTPYFEAKPRRGVGFDEVGAFVIPYDADVKLKQELLNRGYSIAEYDPKVEGDRQRVVNQFEEYKFSLSPPKSGELGDGYIPSRDIGVHDEFEDFAPIRDDIQTTEDSPVVGDEMTPTADEMEAVEEDDIPIKTVKERLTAKRSNSQTELDNNRRLRAEATKSFDEKIAKAQAQLDSKKNKETKVANNIRRRIERLQRLKADVDAQYAKRISDVESRITKTDAELQKDHTKQDQYERTIARINRIFEMDKADLDTEFNQKRELLADKNSYISIKASELYKEIRGLKKGVKASEQLAYLLDHGYDWSSIRSALVNIKHTPGETVNINSEAESVAREMLNDDFEQAQFNLDSEYQSRLSDLETEAETKRQSAKVANQRIVKSKEYAEQMADLIGDTSTWVDKKMGIQYKVNTLRRNLRDIVRDAEGNRDIAKADAIYDELQGQYNHNEAMLHREANQIKSPYAELKITDAEDAYIQMLGEFRHNPDTELTADAVKDFYEANKDKINTDKVNLVIEGARETYDKLLKRVNEVLREQGMKEIPYRQGYFPHFTEPKQSWLAKLLNWKTKDFDIPTDIAGLTEQFNPNRSWQAFNKQRKSDTTDYSFKKGLDTYVQGALDWIYHIEDIQKRRAFENHIRYVHSEKGIQAKIDAIRKNTEYDADEMQEQIDLVYKEAGNPLNNFVTDFRAGTNTLANKKSSLDRGMEELVNRKVYSVMTNLSNRVTGNMVAGSFSSALTNFIPITQSWVEVSPVSSLRAMSDTIKSAVRDDGTIEKSDFLTNRLRQTESLYKSNWDKVSDKVGFLMEAIDSFTSQTVWRSKYLENISNGMSEIEAIQNADQFAENVIAGRSRGNMPTIFDSKNPLIKTLTAFQLEVNNQYQYLLKDAPQDIKDQSTGKLVKGYATAFLGAYAYNALYSSLVGRDAAFDPIGILEELFKDLFGDDDDEEPVDALIGLTDNILEEVPFVGGLLGGGRIPISSALPYDGLYEAFTGTVEDVANKDWKNLTNEWLNPLWYLAMPLGGGQLRKTIQGLSMFDDDLPISGSYTNSGKLRFPVEDTFGNRLKAGLFGQYSSKNARDYFDNNRSPLGDEQIQEFVDLDIPIRDYWEYREGLKGLGKIGEKADYIDSLDLPIAKKNLLINNIADREDPIDLTGYGNYGSFEEFELAKSDPDKYKIAQAVGGYESYKSFKEGMKDMTLAEKVDYVAGLKLTTKQKNALINGETDRKEPIDLTGYENFDSFEEFEFAKKNPEKYQFFNDVGISYAEYDALDEEGKDAYTWAFKNPNGYIFSKAVSDDLLEYRRYAGEIYDIKADKDKYGKSISGTRKTKVIEYLQNSDLDDMAKIILYKSEYPADDTYNYRIAEYLIGRKDLTYEEKKTILEELDFKIDGNGNISW